MASYIPPRLVPILGVARLDEIKEANLSRLIGLAETADLEFKEQTYGNNAEQSREMAYDIAAMANDVGGLIVIGVADEDGRAASLDGVPPDPFQEEEGLRIQKVVAARLFPHHQIEVHPVPSTSQAGKVFYLVSIPPSAWAPHAVAADLPSLRWPRRSGPGRRWMSESEIADAYRYRHRAEDDQVDRADAIHESLSKEASNADGWLIMTLVPNRSGHMPITKAGIDAYRTWLNGQRAHQFPVFIRMAPFDQVRSDFRSIRFSDAARMEDPPYNQHGRAYADGAGTLATKYDFDSDHCFVEVEDERLLADVVDSLLILGAHAVEQAFTGGDAVVLADLIGCSGFQMVLTGYDGPFPKPDQVAGSVMIDAAGVPISQRTVSLEDIATPGPALIRAARLIVSDLISPFGVPEPSQVSEDGHLHVQRFSRQTQQNVKAWADKYGIET